MNIRKANINDLEQLEELRVEFLKFSNEIDNTLNSSCFREIAHLEITSFFKESNSIFFIAEDKKEIIGYVYATFKKSDKLHITDKYGEIAHIYITEKYTDRGIGKKLINEVLEWLRYNKVDEVGVKVYFKNKRAVMFYKSLGFETNNCVMKKKLRYG